MPLLQYMNFLPRVRYENRKLYVKPPISELTEAQLQVNNMIIDNIEFLHRFTIDDVEYISVVIPGIPYLSSFSFSDYPYRIEIILKEGAGIERDFTVYKTIGYSENAEFYHPIYDTPEKINGKTPDLRTTLYWNPYLQTGPDGKAAFEFYSADSDNSQYEITIEGVAPNGSICQHQKMQ